VAELTTLQEESGERMAVGLLNQFRNEAAEAVARLQKAVVENDAALIERIAHNLKGSSRNLGARRLGRSAEH